MTYRAFRTGLTYQQVYAMLWVNNDDPATWRRKSRGVVLGFWHQLKKDLWDEYINRGGEVTEDAPVIVIAAAAPPPPMPPAPALRSIPTGYVPSWMKTQRRAPIQRFYEATRKAA